MSLCDLFKDRTTRQLYEILLLLKTFPENALNKDSKNELIKECKRVIRERNHENEQNKYIFSHGNWDSWWTKEWFEEPFTEKEKEDYIEDHWIHATPSQYDCTGQTFTVSIYVFNVKVNGVERGLVYHFLAIDV